MKNILLFIGLIIFFLLFAAVLLYQERVDSEDTAYYTMHPMKITPIDNFDDSKVVIPQ